LACLGLGALAFRGALRERRPLPPSPRRTKAGRTVTDEEGGGV